MKPSLHVQFDGQILSLQRHGGIARYIVELARRLHVTAGVSIDLDRRWSNASWADLSLPGPCRSAPSWMPGPLRLAATCAASFISTPCTPGSVYHPTYYFLPRRRRRGAALVTTMHDLIPERLGGATGGRLPSWVRRRSAMTADLCLCVSQQTADDVHEIFAVPRDRLLVVPHGLSALPLARPARPHDRPYILYVGLRSGYKNWPLLKQAYEREPRLHGAVDLVCVGGGPLRQDENVQAGQVRQIAADDQLLADLYAHAEAFVYPSRYEGFGLPLLEAMTFGCPVVTTRGGALPEVGGDAAHYVDVNRPDELASTLLEVLSCGRSSAIARRGPKRAASFTWDRTANLTLAGYRQALEIARD